MHDPLSIVLGRLDGVQRSGENYRSRCPACGGASKALSVRASADGRVLLHCFKGCSAGDIVTALGLTLGDLFDRGDVAESRVILARAKARRTRGSRLSRSS